MEEQTSAPVTTEHQGSKLRQLPLILIALILVVCMGMAVGVYLWQQAKVKDLTSQIKRLHTQQTTSSDSSSRANVDPSGTFTYRPKTGGLTLVLPKSYGIIVNVDGNKGGAAGATFRVASRSNANVFTDSNYQSVRVDIDNGFTTLADAVRAQESKLDSERGAGSTMDRNYTVLDTTIAGLQAKKITAEGLDEYQGPITVYLVGVGSGANSFLYSVTANNVPTNSPSMLDVVLKGLTIKPASV